jgi:hypothetical protein
MLRGREGVLSRLGVAFRQRFGVKILTPEVKAGKLANFAGCDWSLLRLSNRRLRSAKAFHQQPDCLMCFFQPSTGSPAQSQQRRRG